MGAVHTIQYRSQPQHQPSRLAQGKDFPYPAPRIQSRISSKAQTIIPRAVRSALGRHEGDTVAYQIENGRVILTKAEADDGFVGNFSTFTEWADEADSAYDVLGRS